MILNCKIAIRPYTIYYIHGFPIYVVLKSIYMIGANIKISLYHEIAILVLDQGRGKLLNIENHRICPIKTIKRYNSFLD